jgi:hypothetical protein
MMRKLGLAVAAVSAGAAGVYFFIYLVRWEWNRALVSAVIFVAVEILVLGAALMGRMARLERAIETPPAPPGAALAHLRAHRPPAGRPFAWLDPKRGQTGVFVPVLMGAGLVVSALAWLVERVARLVARPGMEIGLAGQLDSIAYPSHLVRADPEPPSAVALLDGPVGRR